MCGWSDKTRLIYYRISSLFDIFMPFYTRHVQLQISSNHNRANERKCVRKPTAITADVTITKIAGYVRVPILMNR